MRTVPVLPTGAVRRAALLVSTGAALALVTLGLVYRGDREAGRLDREVADALPGPSPVLEAFADLGSAPVVALLLGAVVVAAVLARRAPIALLTVLAVPLAVLIELGLKHVFGRILGDALAYPSGHATAVTVIVGSALLVTPAVRRPGQRALLRVVLAVLPALTAAGLVTQGYHYPTDTVGGICLGLAVTAGTALALDEVRFSRPASRGASGGR